MQHQAYVRILYFHLSNHCSFTSQTIVKGCISCVSCISKRREKNKTGERSEHQPCRRGTPTEGSRWLVFFFVSQEASPPTHPTKVNLFSANVEVDFGGVGWGGCFSQFGCGSPCSQDFKANRFRNSISKFDFRNSISKFDFEVRFSKFDFRNSILKFDFEIRFSKFDFEIRFRNSRASFFFFISSVLCSLQPCCVCCAMCAAPASAQNPKPKSQQHPKVFPGGPPPQY